MANGAWSKTMTEQCSWCGENDSQPCEVCGTICERCCPKDEHKRKPELDPRWQDKNMPRGSVEVWAREMFGGGQAA